MVAGAAATGCHPRPTPIPAARAASALQTAVLTVRGHRMAVEVARQPAERNLGLMFRRSLAPDSGMLFVFDTPETLRFWMKNTTVPLSIAYLDSTGSVIDILEMAPLDTTTPYVSSRAALYAVEMNAGWFQSRSIESGDTVSGLPGR